MKATLLITNSIFINLSNPMSIGMTLIAQTITISVISGAMMPNFWFSYIVILVYLGGMLILFIYMASLASNEKFFSNSRLLIMAIIISMTLLPWNESPLMMKDTKLKEMINLTPPVTLSSSAMTIMLISYLLLALIAVVKMTKFWQGSLRTN